MSCQPQAPAALHPTKKNLDVNCIGGWVGPGAGLDVFRKDWAQCQASAAVWMWSSFFWDVTQSWMVVNYRRFETAYRASSVRIQYTGFVLVIIIIVVLFLFLFLFRGPHGTYLYTALAIFALTINVTVHFWRSADRASWQIVIIKPTECTNFSNLFLE